jgi:hypothetical protein
MTSPISTKVLQADFRSLGDAIEKFPAPRRKAYLNGNI